MSITSARYYCEPCFGSKAQLLRICQALSKNDQEFVNLEYHFHYVNPKFQYSISIFQINAIKDDNDNILVSYFKLNEELQKINKRNALKSLKNNELSLPQYYFKLKSLDFIPLRICSSIPIFKDRRYVFNFSNEIEKYAILHNFENFVQKTPFTHFIALPISPIFPNWLNSFKKVTTDLRINQFIHFNIIHITLGIFLVDNEEELCKINQIVKETIGQIQWPQNNFLKTSKVDAFQWPQSSTVFLKPEDNSFTQSLFLFVKLFLTKLQENGFAYADASQVFHITFLKNFPNENLNYVIQNLNVNELPPIPVQELRLVQRNDFDEDGFFKTVFRYQIYSK